jgi:hypothetical protein
MAQPGGVLIRSGHTEAGCDLAAMAGCSPTSVICEIMKDDGSMARLPDLLDFAKEHQLKIGSIADLIQYRSQHESIVVREGERDFITPWGKFKGVIYRDKPSSCIHIALVVFHCMDAFIFAFHNDCRMTSSGELRHKVLPTRTILAKVRGSNGANLLSCPTFTCHHMHYGW